MDILCHVIPQNFHARKKDNPNCNHGLPKRVRMNKAVTQTGHELGPKRCLKLWNPTTSWTILKGRSKKKIRDAGFAKEQYHSKRGHHSLSENTCNQNWTHHSSISKVIQQGPEQCFVDGDMNFLSV